MACVKKPSLEFFFAFDRSKNKRRGRRVWRVKRRSRSRRRRGKKRGRIFEALRGTSCFLYVVAFKI
jgi:hypothetical protein